MELNFTPQRFESIFTGTPLIQFNATSLNNYLSIFT